MSPRDRWTPALFLDVGVLPWQVDDRQPPQFTPRQLEDIERELMERSRKQQQEMP